VRLRLELHPLRAGTVSGVGELAAMHAPTSEQEVEIVLAVGLRCGHGRILHGRYDKALASTAQEREYQICPKRPAHEPQLPRRGPTTSTTSTAVYGMSADTSRHQDLNGLIKLADLTRSN